MILTLAALASAACPEPTRAAEVRRQLDVAYQSLEALDIAAFKAAVDAIDAAIPCLAEPLLPAVVAEVHRTKGIRAFGERDAPLAQAMFASARVIEPGYRFPFNLIPDGNPIRDAYLAIPMTDRVTVQIQPPTSGDIRLDGYSSLSRASSWPVVAQYLFADGTVGFSAYLLPADPLPPYPAAPVAPPLLPPTVGLPLPTAQVPSELPPPPRPRRARVPLLVAAGVVALGSGALYGVAGLGEDRFNDPATPDADLDALRSRTNTMVVVSGFGGAAAAGLAIAGVAAK